MKVSTRRPSQDGPAPSRWDAPYQEGPQDAVLLSWKAHRDDKGDEGVIFTFELQRQDDPGEPKCKVDYRAMGQYMQDNIFRVFSGFAPEHLDKDGVALDILKGRRGRVEVGTWQSNSGPKATIKKIFAKRNEGGPAVTVGKALAQAPKPAAKSIFDDAEIPF